MEEGRPGGRSPAGPEGTRAVTLRYTLSQLSRPEARRVFGRTWLTFCGAGALLTLLLVGGRHLVFVVMVWTVVVFAPVRIAAEVLHTVGPRLRQQLYQDVLQSRDRYTTPERVALMVEILFAREVLLPRLAPPDLGPKVVEAASRLCTRALRRGRGAIAIAQAARACGALLDRWVATIAAGEAGSPLEIPITAMNGAASTPLWDSRASIQDQWVTLRAIAGLAALTKVLTAVYEDSTGSPLAEGPALRRAADTAMDFADQVGLRLEGPPWEAPRGLAHLTLPPEVIGRLADRWREFCAQPLPAPRRLRAFLEAVPEPE